MLRTLLVVALLTDAVDGYLARTRNAITNFGELMDPVADKPTQQGLVIAASGWGKTKTILQVAAIPFLIAYDPSPVWVDLLVYAAVAITVISGTDYFFGMRRAVCEAEERRRAAAAWAP